MCVTWFRLMMEVQFEHLVNLIRIIMVEVHYNPSISQLFAAFLCPKEIEDIFPSAPLKIRGQKIVKYCVNFNSYF